MFRLTEWCSTANELTMPLKRLESKGVPSAIVERREYPKFSIWRSGCEAVVKNNKPYSWRRDYEIVMSVHGFDGTEEVCQKETVIRKSSPESATRSS